MRALLQRVSEAGVTVEGASVAAIGRGLLVLLGVGREDTRVGAERLAHKIIQLRIFPDQAGKMNLSLGEVGGELLIVSQFTLYADTRKGNRPSYTDAAPPKTARELYDHFVETCQSTGTRVSTGVFQADMQVRLINDGPVTILCSSEG